jgi:PcfJ-like protein
MAQESDSPKTGRATRNVLNVAEVDEYTALIAEGEAPHIRDWLTSTFSRWLKNECEDVRICLDSRLWDHPLLHIANTFFSQIVRPEEGRQSLLEVRDRMARPVQVLSQPQWLGNALATGQIVYEVDIDAYAARDTVPHMKDFMRTLPERPIRMSIPQMVEAILAWDALLAKQEAISDLSEGVTLMESTLFDETPYFMVKLDSKDSYTNEGAAMRHCVASYAGRKHTSIYSLRSAQETRPVATIEITKGVLIQCKGFANATVSDEVRRLIDEWVTASGFKLHAPSPTRRVRRGSVYGDWEIEVDEDGREVLLEGGS